jgi:hypothetical protein
MAQVGPLRGTSALGCHALISTGSVRSTSGRVVHLVRKCKSESRLLPTSKINFRNFLHLDFHTKRILELVRRFEYFCQFFLGELLAPVTYGPTFQHRYMHLGAKCLPRTVFFLPKLLRFCFLVCFKVIWGHKLSFFNAQLLFGVLFLFIA